MNSYAIGKLPEREGRKAMVSNRENSHDRPAASDHARSRFFCCERETEVRMEETLREAIEQKQFELFIQLIFDVHEHHLIGGEALARWRHPKRGLVSPAEFIPALLNEKIIDKLDFFMFEECCRYLQEWKNAALRSFVLSCNFSRMTLASPDFRSRLQAILDRYTFDRDRLIVEITEDTATSDRDRALENIRFCKSSGFLVAIDDMGAGCSSLTDLYDFPIDIVKIDRAITRAADKADGADQLRGIVELAHHLGMRTLCEGAETEQELNAVVSCGADFVQGYYFSVVYDVPTAIQRYQAQN